MVCAFQVLLSACKCSTSKRYVNTEQNYIILFVPEISLLKEAK